MSKLPIYSMPTYDDNSREDALFHYTTGTGLIGILTNNEIWSTAYYCANDESELHAAKNFLTSLFQTKTTELIREDDSRVRIIASRGVDIREYADKFENMIVSHTLNVFGVYITCFCKPNSEEDFSHGLLSQWRGYGLDGGYAVQFSRSKLKARVDAANEEEELAYDLQDVYYSPENELKVEIEKHADAYVGAYLEFLDTIVNFDFNKKTVASPIAKLPGGPLERLLDFLICTKSGHFREEKECRLSILQGLAIGSGRTVEYFNRNGLVVPYVKSPPSFNVLDCIDWIIVGPSPRISSRFKSVTQMVKTLGLDIKVRPSRIPFTRM